MELQKLISQATDFLLTNPHNKIQPQDAIREDLVGIQIYDAPIFGVGSAKDPLFDGLKHPDVIHPDYLVPTQWLDEAKSVISFFLPFTKKVKDSNGIDFSHPSDEWLHARIEGEEMLNLLRTFLRDALINEGFPSVAPVLDSRFHMLARFASNWSERHTAYICGLGTFGLSKNLITQKGAAGRIGSVITTHSLPVTPRPYTSFYEYCNMCGKCSKNCPVNCIDPVSYTHLDVYKRQ